MANPHPTRNGGRRRTRLPAAEVTAAIVVLHKPGAMSDQGRREISQWLRRQADALVTEGAEYNDSGRFVARYMYEPRKRGKI